MIKESILDLGKRVFFFFFRSVIDNRWVRKTVEKLLLNAPAKERDNLINYLVLHRLKETNRTQFHINADYQIEIKSNCYASLAYWSNTMPYCYKSILKAGSSSVSRTLLKLDYYLKHIELDPDLDKEGTGNHQFLQSLQLEEGPQRSYPESRND